ncbi:MAG: pyrimidine-nucleoside phosphorylase [Clostridia bacterium]|nr:pyrimidine-nucleoside phosphorylase [Clostridia bacterium]
MRMYDIIRKKRDGYALDKNEIDFFIKGYTDGSIPDYQASALMMAIYFNGMTDEETANLTIAMADSGDKIDLSEIDGVTVDKHSTGGVGDKTTLIVAPVVASLGCKVAKMSGRGLGHTGGTVDKLESVNGFRVELTPDEFISQVKSTGICVVGQSGNLAPADKKLYALRDVTATVNSIPLIASSIMSKKLAAGSECIVLDVKTGSGAFMKSPEEATELAEKMVDIGKKAGRKTAALITDMDIPLGTHIGNTLEVQEAVSVLRGETDNDLKEVCIALAANIVSLAKNIPFEKAEKAVNTAISDGSAFSKFRELVMAQGGDVSLIDDTSKLPKAEIAYNIISDKNGYISHMNAEIIGSASVVLGAGREKKDDTIDYTAGIILNKKTGDYVSEGGIIATLYTNDKARLSPAGTMLLSALDFSDIPPRKSPLIYKTIN